MSSFVRTADPYGDLDVIDARAPRFNQTIVGLGSAVAVLTGVWPILALLAAQLGIGLRFGRRSCIPCVVYFKLIQPRIGEGPIEDSRPPRFANQVGFTVLTLASLAYQAAMDPEPFPRKPVPTEPPAPRKKPAAEKAAEKPAEAAAPEADPAHAKVEPKAN